MSNNLLALAIAAAFLLSMGVVILLSIHRKLEETHELARQARIEARAAKIAAQSAENYMRLRLPQQVAAPRSPLEVATSGEWRPMGGHQQ